MNPLRAFALALSLSLLGGLVGASPAGADGHEVTDHVVTSPVDGLGIHITVYRPAGASAEGPAPVILHSHGWGGSRTSASDAFAAERARGYGVVSIDQRGHGDTGGTSYVQHTDFEGRDIIAVIDYLVDTFDWIARDADPDDPVLFAMGGSYGGGYQLMGALTELDDTDRTRFNALAPEITWYDLQRSLAPERVVRSIWVTALYAAGLDMHQQDVHTAFAYGAATGQWPDGSVPGLPNMDEVFGQNGPSYFVERPEPVRLDIPVLFGQGTTDNLFNLNEGWKIFERALTADARDHSVFIGYNGGHALPGALPPGTPLGLGLGTANGDLCSGPGGFGELRLDFFDAVRAGENPRDLPRLTGDAYNVTDAAGETCIRTDTLDAHATFPTGIDVGVTRTVATTTGLGAPQHVEVAQGPITVSGIPFLEADVTTVGADQRVFFALAVGENPATARIVQNNMMPLRELLPVVGEGRTIELPGVAVEVPEGQSLYLTISPVSDMSFGHGSIRSPGAVVLEDLEVRLPVVTEWAGSGVGFAEERPAPRSRRSPSGGREAGPAPRTR